MNYEPHIRQSSSSFSFDCDKICFNSSGDNGSTATGFSLDFVAAAFSVLVISTSPTSSFTTSGSVETGDSTSFFFKVNLIASSEPIVVASTPVISPELPLIDVIPVTTSVIISGADTITCGGLDWEYPIPALVKVIDDGDGMTRDDAILSIERHATSKLSNKYDLNNK